MRNAEEIKIKIKNLVGDDTNFVNSYDGTGLHEEYYSESTTEETLKNYTNWLLEKEII